MQRLERLVIGIDRGHEYAALSTAIPIRKSGMNTC